MAPGQLSRIGRSPSSFRTLPDSAETDYRSHMISTQSPMQIAKKPVPLFGRINAVDVSRPNSGSGLTQREAQLLDLLIEECGSNSDIATSLNISEETVKRHLSNICDKTGFSTRLELAVRTMQGRMETAIEDETAKQLFQIQTQMERLAIQLAQSESKNSMHGRMARISARQVHAAA